MKDCLVLLTCLLVLLSSTEAFLSSSKTVTVTTSSSINDGSNHANPSTSRPLQLASKLKSSTSLLYMASVESKASPSPTTTSSSSSSSYDYFSIKYYFATEYSWMVNVDCCSSRKCRWHETRSFCSYQGRKGFGKRIQEYWKIIKKRCQGTEKEKSISACTRFGCV